MSILGKRDLCRREPKCGVISKFVRALGRQHVCRFMSIILQFRLMSHILEA